MRVLHSKNSKILICTRCRKEFRKYNADIRKTEKHDGKHYCCRSCASKNRITTDETKNKISISVKNSVKFEENNKKANEKRINSLKRKHIKKECPICKKEFSLRQYQKNRIYCSCICYNTISGGIKRGSSRGKSGWYKGCWCDSSYELAWVIYNIEHSIQFKRNNKGFPYLYEEKQRLFYPDFIVDNGYVEIKNYHSDLTDAKLLFFPHKIEIIYKEEIKPYLSYVKNKYGNNFISLYENGSTQN